jgi:hypothetical protein
VAEAPRQKWCYFVICVSCSAQIIVRESVPSPEEEPQPKSQSVLVACPVCGTEHLYEPASIGRGQIED